MKDRIEEIIIGKPENFVTTPPGHIAILVVNVLGVPMENPEIEMFEAANQLGQFAFNKVTDRDRDIVFVPQEALANRQGLITYEYVGEGTPGGLHLEAQYVVSE